MHNTLPMKWPDLLNVNRQRPSTMGDDRNEFERDFDRAVFSTPVKRLQDKAQVFPLEPHDAVRTRLTHSLEVSSVARGLAIRSAKWLLEKNKISKGDDRSIEAIAATCGLIHDLGNPPFGHAGEDAIRYWFNQSEQKKLLRQKLGNEEQHIQDFLKFEGNAQTLRLVAKLQVLADYSGLNLTFGTLSALCKYVASSDQADKEAPDHAHSKPGYFASEAELVKKIRDATGTGAARNPICFLVEAADDIVYLAADVEDAVKKKVLSWEKLRCLLLKATDSDSMTDALNLKDKILKVGCSEGLDGPDDDIKAAAFRTAAISVMVRDAFEVFKVRYDKIMHGQFLGELLKESKSGELEGCLRKIGINHVYPTRSTLTLELMGRQVIGNLMDIFWEGARVLSTTERPDTSGFAGKIGALFSENYLRVFRHSATGRIGLPEEYHRLQLVTDYICGMTDSFAKRLHADLFNGR